MSSLKLLVGLLTMALVIAGLYFGSGWLPCWWWWLPAVLGVLAGASVLLGQQVRMLAVELPTYQTTMRDKLRGIRESMSSPGVLERAMRTFDEVEREITGENDKNTPGSAGGRCRGVKPGACSYCFFGSEYISSGYSRPCSAVEGKRRTMTTAS